MPPRSRPSLILLTAAGISAVITWLLQVWVARRSGPADYSSFMVIWSAVFLAVAMTQGVQQGIVASLGEADSGNDDRARPGRKPALALMSSLSASLLLIATMAAIGPWPPLLLGLAALVASLPLLIFHQAYNGGLAASDQWGLYGTSVVVEAGVRCLAVAGAVAAGFGLGLQASALVIGGLGWLVTAAFPAARRATRILVSGNAWRMATTTASATVATFFTAIVVTGFPVLAHIFLAGDPQELGVVLAAVMLTRAPILFPLSALQAQIIVRLKRHPASSRRTLLALVMTATTVAALGSLVFGSNVIRAVLGRDYMVSDSSLALLMVAAGATAVLSILGWECLVLGWGRLYGWSWGVTTLALLCLLQLPLETILRTAVALTLAPIFGIAVIGAGHFRRVTPLPSGGAGTTLHAGGAASQR